MIRNLREKLFEIHNLPMAEQKDILHKTIIDWIGPKGTRIDDILLVEDQNMIRFKTWRMVIY